MVKNDYWRIFWPYIYRHVTVTHKQAFTIAKLMYKIKQLSHITSRNES